MLRLSVLLAPGSLHLQVPPCGPPFPSSSSFQNPAFLVGFCLPSGECLLDLAELSSVYISEMPHLECSPVSWTQSHFPVLRLMKQKLKRLHNTPKGPWLLKHHCKHTAQTRVRNAGEGALAYSRLMFKPTPVPSRGTLGAPGFGQRGSQSSQCSGGHPYLSGHSHPPFMICGPRWVGKMGTPFSGLTLSDLPVSQPSFDLTPSKGQRDELLSSSSSPVGIFSWLDSLSRVQGKRPV